MKVKRDNCVVKNNLNVKNQNTKNKKLNKNKKRKINKNCLTETSSTTTSPSSEFEILQKQIIQLCNFKKDTDTPDEICNSNDTNMEFKLKTTEKGSDMNTNNSQTIKYFSGYNFCALEAKKFLITNGIDESILKKFYYQQLLLKTKLSHQESQNINNFIIKKENTILSEKNIEKDNLQYVNHNKKEIFEKIRLKIFERRRMKMLNEREKINVWRPW